MSNESPDVPPSTPPPLLTADEIRHLASHGWLCISPPDEFRALLHDLSSLASAFFDLSSAEKQSLYPPSRGTESGFYRVENEKEYLTLRHHVYLESELERTAANVWRWAGILLYRILCDVGRAAELRPTAWDKMMKLSLDLPASDANIDDIPTLMRLFHYYPTGGFAAEHVDLGLLTLCVGKGRGLQVLDRSIQPPDFIDAEGPTVVVGDMLRTLLRNRVRPGVHRVIGNPEGRDSIIFALRPYLDDSIDLADFGGDGVVDTRELYEKVKGSKYNINATKVIREHQKKEQRELRKMSGGPGDAFCGQG